MSLRSPAGAWLVARMLAWRLALPLLKRALPLPRLARMAAGRRRRPLPFTPAQVVSVSHRLFGERAAESSDCLERSLLTYRYLLRTGAAAELVCGLRRADGGVVGHAWVAVAGAPVDEPAEALTGYATLVAFDASGARV
jgi:hypothetical protein